MSHFSIATVSDTTSLESTMRIIPSLFINSYHQSAIELIETYTISILLIPNDRSWNAEIRCKDYKKDRHIDDSLTICVTLATRV